MLADLAGCAGGGFCFVCAGHHEHVFMSAVCCTPHGRPGWREKRIGSSRQGHFGQQVLTCALPRCAQGVIQHATINNLAFGRNVEETLRILQAIQYVQENPDEVCPAGWKPGENTMKPDPKGSKEYFAAL